MIKQKLNLSILINAPKEKIWNVLLQDGTYRKWTSVFCEGSYADGSWDEGSKILFSTPKGEGMVSWVLLHIPNEIITLKHLGILINNRENYDSDEAKKWIGSRETYLLEPKESGYELIIEQDITDDYLDWFKSTWQKALEKVKELSEK